MDQNKGRALELIEMGENSSVEFKSENVRAESIAKEMVAFSNSLGGVILIGVEDDGSISGCEIRNVNEEKIMNIARTSVLPAIVPECKVIEIKGKSVLLVTVLKGKNKPYQTNENKFLVRVGSTNRVATQAELLRLFQQSGFFHYDLVAVAGSAAQSLNFSQIDGYFNKYDVDFTQEEESEKIQLLKNIDVLTELGECTVGGLLIFGINPQRYLLNSSISIAKFKGTEIGSELIDTQVIEGVLPFQVDTATALIKNLIPVASTIVGNKRVDSNGHFSEKVFRELLVNAVVHRNYSIEGSRIRVFIFDDRLEVRSPGRLPNTVTVQKIVTGVSYAINPVLLKFMENMRYVDKLGRGIPMICAEAKRLGKEVQFEEVGEEFVVTLYL